MVLYHTMIVILPRAPCCHRVLQHGQHVFSFWWRHMPPGYSVACGFFLIGRKRRRVEPHASVVVFRSFKSFKSFKGQQGQKN
jgi:hypothetical protein